MKKQIPLYLIVIGIGIIIGVLIRQPAGDGQTNNRLDKTQAETTINSNSLTNRPAQDTANIESLQNQINELEIALSDEIESRENLTKDILQLKQTLVDSSTDTSEEEPTPANRTLRTRNRQNPAQNGQWFNTQALLDAGVDQSQAQRIREIYEDVQMQKLYLRDKAVREGWIGDERYRTERAKLDDKLDVTRDELGEKGYDAYLYAAGLPNRVIITSALNNSPASKAGIQAGDTVLKYDNKRIYSWSDLRNATSTGEPSAVVLVELLRNGEPVNVFLPRGPLGVQLDNTSIAPVN